MSIISGIGGSGSELIQMLQQIMARQNGSPERTMGRPGEPPGGGGPGAMMRSELASFAEAAGLDSEAVASLQEEVKSAITTTLEESEGSGDPKEAVQTAIRGVLDNNGLDGEAFLGQLQDARSQMRSSGMRSMGMMGGQPPDGNMLSQVFGTTDDSSELSTLLSNLSFGLVDYLA